MLWRIGRTAVAAVACTGWAYTRTAGSLVTDWNDSKKALTLERNYRNPEVQAQRSEMLRTLQPAAGERVLDIGCGPGFLLEDLNHQVGESGHVEGCDPSLVMCELAEKRLPSHVIVKPAKAEELPYRDESFDVVVLSQVLLYVHDVPKALEEARRVLRPGGRLLICDTDWNSLVVNTGDKERLERIRTACGSTFVHASLPPKLPGLLAKAGLVLTDVQTVPMIGAGKADWSGASFVGNWAFRVVPDKARAHGLPQRDVDDWLVEQKAMSEANEFFVCVHRFLFLAHKPEA
eukprot:TRINITY_DN8179_c0_g1_i1.p1 TRINITY_DN8179_c0_g1~~TRINITY_DN8179_c0_g1_i1.p1  ORF type:complete len:290 (+),score=55.28 TRINITY_DN8179_c0_g1_i1:16-885(+)